jgi:hypothetical protein
MKAALSEARKAQMRAMPSARTRLPLGCRLSKTLRAAASLPGLFASSVMRPRSDGVSSVPGQTVLKRRPLARQSAAQATVRPITPPLAAPWAAHLAKPLVEPATEAMVMTLPPCCFSFGV